jgi:hypothetical protein
MRGFYSQTLIAAARANNYSTKSHVPSIAISCRFRKDQRGPVKKALKKISKSGLVIRHPTRGGMTWQLTKNGLDVVKSLEGN